MAFSQTKQASVLGPTTWMLINLNAFRGGVGLLANLSAGGTATYNVEVTGQDPKLPNFGTVVNIMDGMGGLTGSVNNSLAYPCTAIRLNILSIAAGTTVSLSVVQSVD